MGFLDRILGRDPASLKAKGDSLREAGRWGLARHEYAAALAGLEGSPEADEVRGRLDECEAQLAKERCAKAEELAELGHVEEAQAALREALELTRDDEGREAIFDRMRSIDEQAASDAADAEDVPADPEGEEFLGEAPDEQLELRLLGVDDPARADAYRCMPAEFQAGWIKLEDGDAPAAIAALEPLLADDDSGYVARELGRALLLDGRFEEAAQRLREYLGADVADDPAAAESLAVALWRGPGAEEAVGVLDDVLEADPDRLGSRVMLADIYLDAGQAEDAVEIAQEGIDRSENDSVKTRYSPLYHVLGAAQAVLGLDQDARDSWETALGLVWRVDHDSGELHFVPETAWALATHLLKMGEDAEKAVDLLMALEKSPGSVAPAEVQMAMARGLQAQDDLTGARDALVAARTLMTEEDGRARVDAALAELEDCS